MIRQKYYHNTHLPLQSHTVIKPHIVEGESITDTERNVPPGEPEGASCVQEFDDSLNSAIRITYRISLRSSSLREPRYPLLRVVSY